MRNLILIRHAETDMAGRFCGHSDPELNRRGRGQLARVVSALSERAIRRVYTSDLRRARQTAEAVAEHFGVELYLRPGVREIHFGLWEGLSWSEIEGSHPALARSWAQEYPNHTAPGGETFVRFVSRAQSEINFLRGEAAESPIAVVTHAGFIRVVLTSLCGMSQHEAWDRTKEYGSIVALDTNDIDGGEVENLRQGAKK